MSAIPSWQSFSCAHASYFQFFYIENRISLWRYSNGHSDKWIEDRERFSLLIHLARPFVCMHTSMAGLYQSSLKWTFCSHDYWLWPENSTAQRKLLMVWERRVEGERKRSSKGDISVSRLVTCCQRLWSTAFSTESLFCCFFLKPWLSAHLPWLNVPVSLVSLTLQAHWYIQWLRPLSHTNHCMQKIHKRFVFITQYVLLLKCHETFRVY